MGGGYRPQCQDCIYFIDKLSESGHQKGCKRYKYACILGKCHSNCKEKVMKEEEK
jgi:hypothetical protein